MKITLLTRTSNRPNYFKAMLKSVFEQTFTDWEMIVAYDNDAALNYIPEDPRIKSIKVKKQYQFSHYWNLYCNTLKEAVTDGWFMFLDDDDYIWNENALKIAAKHLVSEDVGYIFQFIRNGKLKPSNVIMDLQQVSRGRIGSSCLMLHSSYKGIADWDAKKAADYRWIRDVQNKMPLRFIKGAPIVCAGNKGLHGKLVDK